MAGIDKELLELIGRSDQPSPGDGAEIKKEESPEVVEGDSKPSSEPNPPEDAREGGQDEPPARSEWSNHEEEEREEGEAVDDDNEAPAIELREDLVYDEDDRAKLLGMTEVDREMVYAERIETKEREKDRQRLLQQNEEEDIRMSSRRDKDKNRKDTALRELQKRKAQQEAKEHRSKQSVWEEGGSDGEAEEEAPRDVESDDVRLAEISESESDNERGGHRSSMHAWGPADLEEMEDEYADSKDVQSIQVIRSQLERWFTEPHFEQTMPQCFLRMAEADNSSGTVQRGYRIMEVIEVVEKDRPYKFGDRPLQTTKYLRMREGYKEFIREISMVSNQAFLAVEFDRWRQCCERDNRPPLSKAGIVDTRAKIEKAERYRFSSEDVKKLLESKGKRPIRNVAAEKIKLERQREYYEEQKDTAEVEKLNQQIAELTQSKKSSGKGRSDGMASINKRNIMLNFKQSMGRASLGAASENLFDEGLDPFQRRATRPNQYWKTGSKSSEVKAEEPDKGKKRVAPSKSPAPAPPKKRPMTAEEFVEGIRGIEMNLDCNISHPTPAELLVRDILPVKFSFSNVQKELEASLTNGSKKSLTLYDYKKRQGLV
ncbi:hypothetical protein BSKO_06098 [Bryopsis sp. KO-2023]|nr:hypothetical protein BSKO_06098 [Bryopsis sp. KO-2023]